MAHQPQEQLNQTPKPTSPRTSRNQAPNSHRMNSNSPNTRVAQTFLSVKCWLSVRQECLTHQWRGWA